MSRSYRKPYSAVTGVRSAADDKRTARRCWRRAQNHALRSFRGDWDEFLIPARLEASYNEVYSWGRDGKQWICFRPTIQDATNFMHLCYWGADKTQEDIEKEFEDRLERWKKLTRK